MTSVFSGNDVTFMSDTLAQVGSWVEQTGTIFAFSSVGTAGTTAEAGDPQTVTTGTRAASMRLTKISDRIVEKSGGRYSVYDRRIISRGSFSKQDTICIDSGTFRPDGGPYKIYMGSSLFWEADCKKVG